MMQFLRWIAALVLVMTTVGCVKVNQTLTLNEDGSGILDVRYGMSEQTIAQLEAMEQMSQAMGEGATVEQDSPFKFDEADVRRDFEAKKPAGIELESLRSETLDGWKYMELKIAFDDLRALQKTDFFDNDGLSLTLDADGNYVLSQRSSGVDAGAGAPGGGSDGADDGPGAAMETQMMQQMAAMFAGLRIEMSVVVPSEIVDTNARQVSGRRASWVFDIDEDPGVLDKLDSTDMRVVFSGKGLSLPAMGTQ